MVAKVLENESGKSEAKKVHHPSYQALGFLHNEGESIFRLEMPISNINCFVKSQ